jgi:8-oxo-dGTP diphosphatase
VSDAGADADRRLRIGAKALVTAGERVLLIREHHADGTPFWTIPGGGLEPGESLADCLRREIEEEIRCPATVGEPVGSCAYRHTSRPATTVYAVFDAALRADPDPNPAERVTDHAWREPTDLPEAVLDPVERFIERTLTGSDADG